MKRAVSVVVLILIVPFMMGMGGVPGGGNAPEKVPVPDRLFAGSFVDQMDIVTQCTDISIEGKTFVEGKRGEGTYTVDFQNIRAIDFLSKGEVIRGRILLKDNSSTELALKGNSRAYGRTGYGTFQIQLKNLKKMTLSGQTP